MQLNNNNNNNKLSYSRGTARRSMLVNSCNVSLGMGVRKVSSSKSDLQGRSRALAMVAFDRPHAISYQYSTATMPRSCTINDMFSLDSQNSNRTRDAKHINLCTK